MANHQAGNQMFNLWTQNQQTLWTKLLEIPKPSSFFSAVEIWQQPNYQYLTAWGESAIKQLLVLQSNWLEQWSDRMENCSGDREMYTELVDQVGDTIEGWAKTQEKLWQNWFQMLDYSTNLSHISSSQKEDLESWKVSAKEILSGQDNWLEIWREQINYIPLVSSEMREQFTDQLTASLQAWINNQTQMWQLWFDLQESSKGVAKFKSDTKKAPKTASSHADAKDDLKVISGIGPALEKKLYQQGIYSFKHLAELSDAEIEELERNVIGFPGRIRRDNWVEQAKALHSGNQR